MPVLKRPASASGLPSMKKPASHSSIKDVVSELKDSQKHDEDKEGSEEVVRDKQKAQKFHKMLNQGSLPEHMYNIEAKKSKDGARAFQTRLINSLFQKNKDGTFSVQTEKHEFQEYRKIYHQSIAKDKTEALPRTIMLASHFGGNEALLKKALDNGELVSKVDKQSNVEYLQYRKLTNAEVRGNEEGEHVAGSKKLSREQAHSLASVMAKLKWKFELSKAGGVNMLNWEISRSFFPVPHKKGQTFFQTYWKQTLPKWKQTQGFWYALQQSLHILRACFLDPLQPQEMDTLFYSLNFIPWNLSEQGQH